MVAGKEKAGVKRLVVVAALALTAALVANAAVFVYYPAIINVEPVKPDVVFDIGTNSNQPDLAGNTITVTIPGVTTTTDGNATEVYITVHPTLQYTYYYDILTIKNNGGIDYYVNIYIYSTNVTSAFTEAYIIIDGTKISLDQTGFASATNLVLPAGGSFSVSLLFYAPDSQIFPQDPVQINMSVVYSPVNEQFQPLP